MNATVDINNIIESNHSYAIFYENPEFWVGLAFIVVIICLIKPLKKIGGKMIQEKILEIKARLDESANLLSEAQKLLSNYEQKYRNADKEAEIISEKNKKQIEYIKIATLSKLEQDIRTKEKEAEERINSTKEGANKEFTQKASTMAIKIVNEAIKNNLSTQSQDMLINSSIDSLKKLKSKIHD